MTVQRLNTTPPDDGNVPDRPSREVHLQQPEVAEVEPPVQKLHDEIIRGGGGLCDASLSERLQMDADLTLGKAITAA